MSAAAIKGWCPGALRPMQSGDGLVVRVRPFGGRVLIESESGAGTSITVALPLAAIATAPA